MHPRFLSLCLHPRERLAVRFGIGLFSFLSTSEERMVSGSCIAKEDDVLYSVVCATLDAVNRIFEGLKTKEPLEYEIEPG